MPRVSVLLPVRDARPWLPAALASLTRQTLDDLEVVAVDDGSRDGSGEWLEQAARSEPRLRVERTAPMGLPAALNRALAMARAPLVARQDADDLSHRERLAGQAAHLEAHPEDDLVGCRVRLFPSAATGAGMRRWQEWHNSLLTHERITRELLLDSPLAHGSAMLRREALERVGGWRERGWAEDLDLWLRLADAGARFAKLPRTLYGWRQHAHNSTRTDDRYAHERFRALKVEALDRGLLAGGQRVTLIGTGESLARWRDALGPRVSRALELREASTLPTLTAHAPLLLVLMAPAARERWRARLTAEGLDEGPFPGRGYAFVS